jgi:DNA (cytosine-5)-methyltransferase 1
MEITMGSLFDGIGGWCIAAERNGAVPVWSSEIEPFCIEVTKKHFPNVMQLGDIRKIKGDKIPPVDIICAGSPCQDLSVAGKREGLKGERSGLFRTANDIVSDMLNATKGEYPKYFIWENVLGAFSSNKGRDFQAVLSEITQADIPMPRSGRWARSGMVRSKRCNIAWRILDAQYWGVPQHRERIFLIACFGNRGGRPEILFESEGMSRNPAESQSKKEALTRTAVPSTETSVYDIGNGQINSMQTLNNRMGTGGNQVPLIYTFNRDASIKNNMPIYGDKTSTLKSSTRLAVVYAIDRAAFNQGANAKYDFKISDNGINSTLVARGPSAVGCIYKNIDCSYVRRLTPLECERLQGLPNNWTKGGSDTARYRAIGNGMAQPCADYVMSKVVEDMKGGSICDL